MSINDMSVVYWTHKAVLNQFLCQGVGEIFLVCVVVDSL